MLNVSLPDGSVRQLETGSTVFDVAKSIGSGLAKSAVAGKINGKPVDLDEKVIDGCKVEILTDRSAEGVDVIRHSTAHLMAMAIQEVFPGTPLFTHSLQVMARGLNSCSGIVISSRISEDSFIVWTLSRE